MLLIVNFRFKIIFNRLIKISAKFQYEAEIQNLLVRKDGSDQKSVKAKQNTKRESSKTKKKMKKKLKEIRKKRAN